MGRKRNKYYLSGKTKRVYRKNAARMWWQLRNSANANITNESENNVQSSASTESANNVIVNILSDSMGEQWLSCQTDVNKLVQRNGNKGETVVWTASTSEGVETKDITLNKPVDVIDEVFTFDEKTVEKTEDDKNEDEKNEDEKNEDDKNEDEKNEDEKNELTSTDWVIHKFLCRCCHAEGDFAFFLTETHEDSSYEDLLKTCFNIQLLPVEGYPGAGALRALCGLCVARLQDAIAFGQQVKAAEERFKELFNGGCIKVVSAVKVEEPDDTDDVGLCSNDVSSDKLLVEDNSKRKKLKPKKQTVKPKPKKKTIDRKKKSDFRTRVGYEYCTLVSGMYKCIKCDLMCKKSGYVLTHFKAVHLKIKAKKCNIMHCEETFESQSQRTLHKLEKHNIDERHKCNACDKYFYAKQQLLHHEKSYHMLGEAIKCTMCDHVSYTNLSMQRHMIKHKNTKDFQCKYCKKAFLRRGTLRYHERIHTGDKRKTCTECGEAFVQKASLNYHMAKYHPEVRF